MVNKTPTESIPKADSRKFSSIVSSMNAFCKGINKPDNMFVAFCIRSGIFTTD